MRHLVQGVGFEPTTTAPTVMTDYESAVDDHSTTLASGALGEARTRDLGITLPLQFSLPLRFVVWTLS